MDACAFSRCFAISPEFKSTPASIAKNDIAATAIPDATAIPVHSDDGITEIFDTISACRIDRTLSSPGQACARFLEVWQICKSRCHGDRGPGWFAALPSARPSPNEANPLEEQDWRSQQDSNLQCSETSTTWSRAGRRRALPEAVCHDFLTPKRYSTYDILCYSIPAFLDWSPWMHRNDRLANLTPAVG